MSMPSVYTALPSFFAMAFSFSLSLCSRSSSVSREFSGLGAAIYSLQLSVKFAMQISVNFAIYRTMIHEN
jgi:hypothetical protein